ncbi:MAG: tetratricopeptide repeat protein [Candidatus Sumerlaeia bacterium]|nr:tetratricopeptide repeat protein [Candidatus Sumerlaeia bacterium]
MPSLRATRAFAAASLLAGAALFAGCAEKQLQIEEQRDQAFALFTEGQRFEADGNYVRAKELYLEAAQVSPRPLFYYRVGHCHYRLGNPEEAAVYYERALAESPDFALARTELDLVRMQLRARELERQAGLERAAAAPPATPVAAAQQPAAQPARQPAAEPAQTRAAEPPAAQAAAPRTTGVGLDGLRSAVEALSTEGADQPPATGAAAAISDDAARKALFPELESGAANVAAERRQAALDSERLGRWDQAVRRWRDLAGDYPGVTEYRVAQARALGKAGRTAAAEREFESLLAEPSPAPETLFAAANFHAAQGDDDRALALYRDANAADPSDPRFRNNLAALLIRGERWGEAKEVAASLTADAPDFAPGWLNMALVAENHDGDSAAALAALDTYLRLGGEGSETIERWRARLRAEAGGAEMP